jgi:NAD(P)-dependent dehydrogenase (short-subunit alcohol dehydrogenase family)
VNNAGANYALPFDEYTEHAWNKVFSLNVKSVHMLTKHLLPVLKEGNTMVLAMYKHMHAYTPTDWSTLESEGFSP